MILRQGCTKYLVTSDFTFDVDSKSIFASLDHFANATHINSTILIHIVAAHFCFRKHAANHTLNFPPLEKFLSAQLAMQESRAQAD